MTSYPDEKNSGVDGQMGEMPLVCLEWCKWIALFHNHTQLLASVTGQRSTSAMMPAIKRLLFKNKNDSGKEREHVPYGGPGRELFVVPFSFPPASFSL